MAVCTVCLIAILGYLLGSIPFGYLLVRIFRSEDIRATGSGNIGATNVIRSGAKGLGAVTFLLDALKGAFAVFLARELAVASLPAWPFLTELAWQASPASRIALGAAIGGMAAVLGHIFPVWLRFKGGKGVATAFGVLAMLAPMAALIALAVFIVSVLLSRYVSLSSILGSITLPVAAALLARRVNGQTLNRDPWLLTPLIVIPAIVIAKHHANIRRLLNGTEYRFGRSKAAA
jgi:glycerol-3-phosphate acyltransferase PlsY